jgi:transaldolase
MTPLRIALGADHGGFETKSRLIVRLKAGGHQVIDVGSCHAEASDYPVFGFRVAEALSWGRADIGVLLCRSGNGIAMAANRVAGVRAAIANNATLARLAREHNEANVLVMGSDYMEEAAEGVLDAFLQATPEGGRHTRRVDIIRAYDRAASSGGALDRMAIAGQSPWLDDISDTLIASGELRRLIEEEGIRGLTSNPSIFEKAINSGQGRYRGDLERLRDAGVTPEEAYERLTLEDIAAAADLLRPLHERSGGDDGFVSLEVLPEYAYDEETTVREATRLYAALARPNVMIKVPGTKEGIRAFRRLTAAGININVTLIFSRDFYNEIAEAYVAGLEDRIRAGGDVSGIRSVASVFVSRIDSAVDKKLEALAAKGGETGALAEALIHRIAIDNTRMIYQDFRSIFYGARFAELAAAGAAVQRPLWGSTSVKNPKLRDTLYAEELVGAYTVNTLPMATVEALIDHGKIRGNTLDEDIDGAKSRLATLAGLGIDIEAECLELQRAGVKSFAEAFDKLFETVKQALAEAVPQA